MNIDTAEENIHEALLAVADIGKDYVAGMDARKRMKKALAKLDEAWDDLAEEIIKCKVRGQ